MAPSVSFAHPAQPEYLNLNEGCPYNEETCADLKINTANLARNMHEIWVSSGVFPPPIILSGQFTLNSESRLHWPAATTTVSPGLYDKETVRV